MLVLLASAKCKKHEEEDASTVFLEAAKSFFSNKDNINGLQGLARAFLQPDGRKEVRWHLEYSCFHSRSILTSVCMHGNTFQYTTNTLISANLYATKL